MIKYPKIEQFRNVIKRVKEIHDYKGKDENGNAIFQHTENYPTLEFEGTVKIHGTNSAIVKHKDNSVTFQSRNNVITSQNDNAGFATFMSDKQLDFLFKGFDFNEYVAIYGEWCGGNIQKGVAINGLDKMFIIFGIRIDGVWIDVPNNLHRNEIGIYNIYQFPTYKVNIDFDKPQSIQNKLIELTIDVENECPIGSTFGKKGVGEGIVFTCISNRELMFKSKGEKHSATKVKKLNAIDTELMNSVNEFVENTVTENRLNQGLTILKESSNFVDAKNTGDFLRWIINDVLTEEKDTLQDSKLEEKQVKVAIVNKARVWFLNQI